MKECCIVLKSVLRGLGGTSGKKEPVENTEYMPQGTRPFLTRDTDQSTRILAHQEIVYRFGFISRTKDIQLLSAVRLY